MTDTIKVKYRISTDMVGSECSDEVEFERAHWEGMSEEEREEVMQMHTFEHIDWNFEVVGEFTQ